MKIKRKIENMEIVYCNRTGNNDILFNLFLKYTNHYPKEVINVDKMLVKDTLDLIHRLDLSSSKNILNQIGIKVDKNLKYKDIQELLKINLPKQSDKEILKFYEENKIKLGCFKYEVIDILKITDYRFYKIKKSLKVVGTQVVNIQNFPTVVNKYDRKYIYEIKLKNEY